MTKRYQGRIEQWVPYEAYDGRKRVGGEIFESPRGWPDGGDIITSPVMRYSDNTKQVETLNSFYLLGKPADGETDPEIFNSHSGNGKGMESSDVDF